jgi:hypothetical protein
MTKPRSSPVCEALVVCRAHRSGARGTSQAGWEVYARRGIPRSGTVRVSQARRYEWIRARQSVSRVIEGAMDDQVRRSGPRRASGQQPGTERDPAAVSGSTRSAPNCQGRAGVAVCLLLLAASLITFFIFGRGLDPGTGSDPEWPSPLDHDYVAEGEVLRGGQHGSMQRVGETDRVPVESHQEPGSAGQSSELQIVLRIEGGILPAGLSVQLQRLSDERFAPHVTLPATAAGSVLFSALKSGIYTVQISGSPVGSVVAPLARPATLDAWRMGGEGLMPWIEFSGGGAIAELVIQLVGSVTVDGAAWEQEGLTCCIEPRESSRRHERISPTTSDGAVFNFEGVMPGEYRVRLMIEGRGGIDLEGAYALLARTNPPPIEMRVRPGAAEFVVFPRMPFAEVIGRLVWSHGAPAEGVPILAYYAQEGREGGDLRPRTWLDRAAFVLADSDGRFQIPIPIGDLIHLQPAPSGALGQGVDWEKPAGVVPTVPVGQISSARVYDVGEIVIKASRSVSVRGRVDLEGCPMVAVEFLKRHPDEYGSGQIQSGHLVSLGEDGTFEFYIEGADEGAVHWLRISNPASANEARLEPLDTAGVDEIDLGLLSSP